MVDFESSVRSWLSAWPIGAPATVQRTPSGSIHQVYQVETPGGTWYLRVYRYLEPAPIEREHAVIRYVAARAVPAIVPCATLAGDSILAAGGRFMALYPAAPGLLVSDYPGCVPAAGLGRALARVHRALAEYPLAGITRRSFEADTAATLHAIAGYQALLHVHPALPAADQRLLAALAAQRAWLEQTRPPVPRGRLFPEQAIHGDYTTANLFGEHGEIVAIIDWDQGYIATRGWEVIRALDLVFAYRPHDCAAFVHGYRSVLPLELAELDAAAADYGWMRGHDLWKYDAILHQGNQRIRAFFPPEGFTPHDQCWLRIRADLAG